MPPSSIAARFASTARSDCSSSLPDIAPGVFFLGFPETLEVRPGASKPRFCFGTLRKYDLFPRLGFRQLSPHLRGVQNNQQRPFSNQAAAVYQNAIDVALHTGAQLDRFIGHELAGKRTVLSTARDTTRTVSTGV